MKYYFQYPVSNSHSSILVKGYRQVGIKYEGVFDILAGIYQFPDDNDRDKIIYKSLIIMAEEDSLFEVFDTEQEAAQYIEGRLKEEGYRDMTTKLGKLVNVAD